MLASFVALSQCGDLVATSWSQGFTMCECIMQYVIDLTWRGRGARRDGDGDGDGGGGEGEDVADRA